MEQDKLMIYLWDSWLALALSMKSNTFAKEAKEVCSLIFKYFKVYFKVHSLP